MTDLTSVLQQVTVRYQHALLKKVSVLGALSVGILSALAWRWRVHNSPPVWSVGLPSSLAIMVLGGLVWWGRRNWISRQSMAVRLDRMLALEQRLVTAAEFATAQRTPALYPLLIEDVARRYSTQQMRFPQPFDRTAAALSGLFLLVLLWPGHRSLMQLARLPGALRPPQPPPRMSPPPSQQDSQSASRDAAPQSRNLTGTGRHDQPSSPQQGPSSPAQGQDQREGQPSPSHSAQQAGGSSQMAGDQSQGSPEQGSGQDLSSAQAHGQVRPDGSSQDQRGEDQGTGATAQRNRAQDQGESGNERPGQQHEPRGARGMQEELAQQSGHNQDSTQSGSSGAAPTSNADEAHRRGSSGSPSPAGSRPGSQQASASQQGQGGRGAQALQEAKDAQGSSRQSGAQAPGGPEALKADIQELLKQVSGELKQLQEQLASTSNLPKPEAGTSSDPNLYDAAGALDPLTGSAMPMPLGTDAAAAKGQRRGGGAGRPSAEAASAVPQARDEDAQLSGDPSEESPIERQPVPPEYRDVFDQLRKRSATSTP